MKPTQEEIRNLIKTAQDKDGQDFGLKDTCEILEAARASIEYGKLNILKSLKINQNSSFEPENMTPLMFAAQKGQLEIVKYLIEEKSARITGLGGGYGNTKTLLQYAAESGNIELCDYLISKGAKIEDQYKYGNSAIASVPKDNKDLHAHLERKKFQEFIDLVESKDIKGRLKKVKIFFELNPKFLNYSTPDIGWTPLHYAAENGMLGVVKYLVEEKKLDINAKTTDGKTALDVANDGGKQDIANYLNSQIAALAKAKTDLFNQLKAKIFEEFIALMMKGGDDLLRKTKSFFESNPEFLYYIDAGFNWTPLHYAAEKGRLDVVKYLVEEKKLDINAKAIDERTPLQVAKEAKRNDVVAYLTGKSSFISYNTIAVASSICMFLGSIASRNAGYNGLAFLLTAASATAISSVNVPEKPHVNKLCLLAAALIYAQQPLSSMINQKAPAIS